MITAQPPPASRTWRQRLTDNPVWRYLRANYGVDTWRSFAYLTVMFLVSFAAFFYFYGTLLFGLSLAITIIGLFIVGALIVAARIWIPVYRELANGLLDAKVEAPPRFVRPSGFWPTLRAFWTDVTGWRAIAFMFLSVPLAILGWGISALLLYLGLVFVAYPFYWQRATFGFWPGLWTGGMVSGLPSFSLHRFTSLGRPVATLGIEVGDPPVMVFPEPGHWFGALGSRFDRANMTPVGTTLTATELNTPASIVLIVLLGLLFLLAWPWVTRLFTRLFVLLVGALLGPTEAQRREATLLRQREVVVTDADARLRQLERELHDGTQAQLVAIGMQVSMAKARLETDGNPTAAAEILDATGTQVRTALAELRDIARGVHAPAIDAGLPVALETLVSRYGIPVALDIAPDIAATEIPPATASIAYYAVAELLTNVVKHAHATQARVSVLRETLEPEGKRRIQLGSGQPMVARSWLAMKVWDDGCGGAVPKPGSGLAGLSDRIGAIDGTMTVVSPAGGPTEISISLPLIG